MARMLKENTTLQHLAMSWNTISDPGAHDLANVLKENNTLEVLDMADNRISSAGATHLARSFLHIPAHSSLSPCHGLFLSLSLSLFV